MDPENILRAANTLGFPALALVVLAGLIFTVVKLIGWGQEVTTLLGNHLRHDLSDLKEETRGVKRSAEEQTAILREQTLVLRTVGNQMYELRQALDPRISSPPKLTTTVTQQLTKEQTLDDILSEAR